MTAMGLTGCGSLVSEGMSTGAGLAGAAVAGSVTSNATVGAAIGLGVKSVADLGLRSVERSVHRAEQDRIAAVAGGLPAGGAGTWAVRHSVPLESDEHGAVVVVRGFAAAPDSGVGFSCKDIVFSVDRGTASEESRAFYTATICRDGTTWKWASAEPATERWGSLQ